MTKKAQKDITPEAAALPQLARRISRRPGAASDLRGRSRQERTVVAASRGASCSRANSKANGGALGRVTGAGCPKSRKKATMPIR